MPGFHNFDRRRSKRFPLRLAADCWFRNRRGGRAFPIKRTGEVQNLSVGGCRLFLPEPDFIEEGMAVRLRIEWPAKIDGRVGLAFHVFGYVLRVEGFLVAISIRRHHFRLKGRNRAPELTKSA